MIYFIQNETSKNVKIGYSADPGSLLRQLQQGNDCILKLIAAIEGAAGVERHYHDAWQQYRIAEKGDHGDEWFSIDVYPSSDGRVRIIGRTPQKKKKTEGKEAYKHQLCLRLTDQQQTLLTRYMAHREFPSGVAAIRAMIDGLNDWFSRQEAKERAEKLAVRSPEPQAPQSHSGPSPVTDVGATDVITEAVTDVITEEDDDDEGTSVGDFAGRPSVRLPESRHDGLD